VGTSKRWGSVYGKDNPFSLQQSVLQGLRACAKAHKPGDNGPVKFIWFCLCGEGCACCADAARQRDASNSAPKRPLAFEEWLAILDESAGLGATAAVLSIGDGWPSGLKLWEFCDWAESAHGMSMGIHLAKRALTEHECAGADVLSRCKTCFFVDEGLSDAMRFVEEMGFRLVSLSYEKNAHVTPECTLPQAMTCVGSDGHLYTCGIVMQEPQYNLGNFFDKKLAAVMTDPGIPHTVPEDICKTHGKCDGCPPLMTKHFEDSDEAAS